jgi:protein TonB
LPALPTAHLPSVSLAARQSALVPAHLLQGKPPQYPQAARPLRLSGTVKLQISISAEGKVTDIRVLSGTPILSEASISAVRSWVYSPAYLDGSPVNSVAEVSLRFTPNRQP